VRCDHPRGAPDNPLTRAQIEDKFRTYGRARLPASRIEEVIGTIMALEDLGSVRELMNSLRPDDEKRIRKSA
jgi:2-methylcitrate dehydratase PrpD